MTTTKPTPPLSHYLIQILKFGLVCGLMYFLFKKGFISLQAMQMALGHVDKMILSIIGICVATILGVTRWRWLLEAQNIHLSWWKVFQLNFIGIFFNIALPGAVSGDFVKAFYIGKTVKTEKSRAFGSILFDRLAGLSALVLVSASALLLGLTSFIHSILFNSIQFLLLTAAITVVVFYMYLFLITDSKDPLLRVFKALEKKMPRASSLTRIYESIRHYHNHRWIVAKTLVISALIHLTVGWCCLNYAQALGENQIPLLSLYVIVPLGLLVTAIPIAPAGVGTGNIAFLYFFHLVDSERGADVYSLYALSQISLSALGGLVYFRFKADKIHPPLPT